MRGFFRCAHLGAHAAHGAGSCHPKTEDMCTWALVAHMRRPEPRESSRAVGCRYLSPGGGLPLRRRGCARHVCAMAQGIDFQASFVRGRSATAFWVLALGSGRISMSCSVPPTPSLPLPFPFPVPRRPGFQVMRPMCFSIVSFLRCVRTCTQGEPCWLAHRRSDLAGWIGVLRSRPRRNESAQCRASCRQVRLQLCWLAPSWPGLGRPASGGGSLISGVFLLQLSVC